MEEEEEEEEEVEEEEHEQLARKHSPSHCRRPLDSELGVSPKLPDVHSTAHFNWP